MHHLSALHIIPRLQRSGATATTYRTYVCERQNATDLVAHPRRTAPGAFARCEGGDPPAVRTIFSRLVQHALQVSLFRDHQPRRRGDQTITSHVYCALLVENPFDTARAATLCW